ncbi:MAG: aldo/keto reductase [Cyclobacteriaceae bacterium]|nr:aldo/keto reductase [Cyclobacteriaceae bacterium]
MTNPASYNRRSFLKNSVTGTTGLLLGTGMVHTAQAEPKEKEIVYRTLGKTGYRLPIVSMGVMRADNPNLVKAALNNGMLHLDTAHGYQGGRNEEMLGRLLTEYSRDRFVIATKVKGENDDFDQSARTVRARFEEKFDISMKRLKLEYVDILYLHAVSSKKEVQYEPYIQTMTRLKKSGKVKFIGVSTHRNEPEVIRAAIESGVYDVVLTSYNFQQDHLSDLDKAIDEAAKAGLGVVAMKTMAGGYFDKERTQPINTQAALKWSLQNPNIHTSIPGFTNFDELEQNLEVMRDPSLTSEEKKQLRLSYGYDTLYCTGCENCLRECKMKLPVPDIMRSYMYTYGYRSPALGKEVLSSLNLPDNACADCQSCEVHCTKKFDLKAKIQDVHRLRHVPADLLV